MARTGRPRAFDEKQALARARDLFWSRGYSATSVQDLVDELAVQRGSLYAAFGDKRTLYLKAVALYDQENRERLETILRAGPVLPALRRILTEPAALTGAQPPRQDRRGCLVGNTTAELVPGDDDAQALVAAAYDGFIKVAAAALKRAQASGEVAATATPEAQAEMLLLLFQGSALVSRAEAARDRLHAGIDAALDALRPAEPHPRTLRGRPPADQLRIPATNSAQNSQGARLPWMTLDGTHLPSLYADGLQTVSTVNIRGLRAETDSESGAVRLIGAHIGGSLNCDGAVLTNKSGPALHADGLEIDGAVIGFDQPPVGRMEESEDPGCCDQARAPKSPRHGLLRPPHRARPRTRGVALAHLRGTYDADHLVPGHRGRGPWTGAS